MEDGSKMKKLYQELKSNKAKDIGRFVENEDERNELLLIKMMKFAARNCPDDEYDFVVRRLLLSKPEIKKINKKTSLTNAEKLMCLFALWRLKKQCTGFEAQEKFIHVIDLVDLPFIVARLKAFQVYAKAVVL